MNCRIGISMFFISLTTIGFLEFLGNAPKSGKHHVSAQQKIGDGLAHCHNALEKDPNNYIALYERAIIYLAQGRALLSLKDLNRVLKIQPDFLLARSQKGAILFKLGHLDEAHIEFDKVACLKMKKPSNQDVNPNFYVIEALKRDYINARLFYSAKKYFQCIKTVTRIIESCPWDIELREMRSACYLAVGEPIKAISDLKAAAKFMSGNTDVYMKLSKLYCNLGEPKESLKQVRECLKRDPEHKECFTLYKKMKKLNKFITDIEKYYNEKNYDGCVAAAKKVVKAEANISKYLLLAEDKLCHCYLQLGQHYRSLDFCSAALIRHPETRLFSDRAENYIAMNFLEEARSDYVDALETDESFIRAQEGFEKVVKLQKKAKHQDYYVILSVERNANYKEINRAYRKMALRWHPDNFKFSKKAAEKKFIEVAAAKEVLTDPEKRRAFDRKNKFL